MLQLAIISNLSCALALWLVLFGPAFAQQGRLPPCPLSIFVWTNCVGEWASSSGNKYVSEFKDDKFNGKGSYTFTNGVTYVGEFRDNKYNGQGTLAYPEGRKKVGIWEDNVLVKSE